MTRLHKLETLIQIEEGIQNFLNRIESSEDTLASLGYYFDDIKKIYTHKIDIYRMCIDRLNQRFNKIKNTL